MKLVIDWTKSKKDEGAQTKLFPERKYQEDNEAKLESNGAYGIASSQNTEIALRLFNNLEERS